MIGLQLACKHAELPSPCIKLGCRILITLCRIECGPLLAELAQSTCINFQFAVRCRSKSLNDAVHCASQVTPIYPPFANLTVPTVVTAPNLFQQARRLACDSAHPRAEI